MSLILEALQKSEHERNLGRVPGLENAVLMESHTAARRWKVAALGILLLNAVAVGGYFLIERGTISGDATRAMTPTDDQPAAEAASAPLAGVRSTALAASEVPTAEPPSVAVAPRLEDIDAVRRYEQTRLPRVVPARQDKTETAVVPSRKESPPSDLAAASADNADGDVPESAGNPVAQAPSPPADDQLPDIAEIKDTFSPPLAPLRLDVHVFSPQADQRFVFINMNKYHEGDEIREGPRVATIETQGVVLDYQGQQFRLTAQ